jgi:hypothetical protein
MTGSNIRLRRAHPLPNNIPQSCSSNGAIDGKRNVVVFLSRPYGNDLVVRAVQPLKC